MNRIPFNLEKAKAGHPLVDRLGRKATFIRYEGNRKWCCVVKHHDGYTLNHTKEGVWHIALKKSKKDLFMIAVTQTKYNTKSKILRRQ